MKEEKIKPILTKGIIWAGSTKGVPEKVLATIQKWMETDSLIPPYGNIHGYFRVNSYDWTIFKFYKRKERWKLRIIEHVQHEGECRKHLELPKLH